MQREWWCHRLGCEQWFQADRDTRTNEVLATWIAEPAGVATPETTPTPDAPAV
ncbi:MAG: sarcosine oxidase subunit delta [Gaiellaceae bacterium]